MSNWTPKTIYFETIYRGDDGIALVVIYRCDWASEDERKYTKLAEYETLSRGAKASAKREIARLMKEQPA